jgi:oxaloacetate decarboxylase gamma subunit
MDMLGQSAVLTVLGMGVVFGFLIIMVVCVSIMGKIIQGLTGDKGAVQTAPLSQAGFTGTVDVGNSAVGSSAVSKSAAVTAAITAAVTQDQKDNS